MTEFNYFIKLLPMSKDTINESKSQLTLAL